MSQDRSGDTARGDPAFDRRAYLAALQADAELGHKLGELTVTIRVDLQRDVFDVRVD